MHKQSKYSVNFSYQLKEMVNSGTSLHLYLNKNKFDAQALSIEGDVIEECDFQRLPETLCDKMISADSEFDQGKLLYEALRTITPREASDIGLWNYLAHNELYRFIHHRWSGLEHLRPGSSQESFIKNHWIMTSSSQGNLIDYPLSGLWWSFYISEDKTREDPYELTRILFQNLQFRTKGFGQAKFSRHKEATIGVLEFIKENKLHLKNFEENGSAITPYVNLLGGARPLGFFDRKWFKNKLEDKFRSDINTYGRLFRRDKRKEDEFSEDTSFPVKSASMSDRSGNPNLIRYFNLFNDGSYELNLTSDESAEWSIPIYDKDEKGFIIQCYNNGRINKVYVKDLLEKRLNKKYANGKASNAELLLCEVIPVEQIIGLFFREEYSREIRLKFHLTEWISLHTSLHLMGNEVTKYLNSLNYKVFPAEHIDKLKRLTKKSSKSSVNICSNYYKKEKNYLCQIWGEFGDKIPC